MRDAIYSRVPNNRGVGVIGGGVEIFWKTYIRGVESGWGRKQKAQIVEVSISNKHIYPYAVCCISVRSF